MRHLILFLLLFSQTAWSQTEYHFSKLTVEDGLSGGHVQAIGQDKFGFIWFGVHSTLNRFDGRNVTQFIHQPDDTTSVLSEMAHSFASDSEGRFFIGFFNGLAEFDFRTRTFHRIAAAKGKHITHIQPIEKDRILLTTSEGIAEFNPTTGSVQFSKDSLLRISAASSFYKNDVLYIGSDKGLILYNLKTKKVQKAPIPALEGSVSRAVVVDFQNNIWVTAHGKYRILKIAPDFSKTEIYDKYLTENEPSGSALFKTVIDPKGRIWICTKFNGLLQYLPETNSFYRHIHNADKQWSISHQGLLSLFCDRDGIIWAGGSGASFFHPDKVLFTSILPFTTDLAKRQRRYARCVTEDKDGNLWLGTRDGLVKYDVKTQTRRFWRNEGAEPTVLAGNIVLALHCDADNNILIGTTQGISFYNRKTDKIENWTGKKGFPKSDYKYFYKDRDGGFWVCTYSETGLLFLGHDQKMHSIAEHPHLKRFAGLPVWTMFQDSKKRFWIVFDEKGLGMYDPATGKTEFWSPDTEGGQKIAGNINIDLKEDKNGVIWMSGFAGLMSIDYAKKEFKVHRHELLKSASYALHIDKLDRIWVSTGSGLVVLDSSRKQFTKFGLSDGLPSLEFTEEGSFQTASGDVILPTFNGYVRFNPMNYAAEKQILPVFIASYYEKGVEQVIPNFDDNAKAAIELGANENTLDIRLGAINFLNPEQTWFAYKLEGLDKDWHFSQDPKVTYINLAGGKYTLRYKATNNVNDWDVPERRIPVLVETVFYKSWWFWTLLLGLMSFGAFQFYQFRERQKQQVFDLLSKAQRLEKEKAVVQYDGLKQQLNPHFLFNSLSSLSSLIQIDPSVAVRFLENLSKTYRYILKSSDSEIVPLRDEIKFAQNFVELQKVRFESGLEVRFDIQEDDLDRKVIPVTLQNMIENAMKHNVIDEETPLKIDIFTEGGYLYIQNNLQKKNFVEGSNKRGLANLMSLYKYFSDNPVTAEETAEAFVVKLPLI